MKTREGWYNIYYDGQNLWIDGAKKQNPDRQIIKAIERVLEDISEDNPAIGQVEVQNGEIDFWERVE